MSIGFLHCSDSIPMFLIVAKWLHLLQLLLIFKFTLSEKGRLFLLKDCQSKFYGISLLYQVHVFIPESITMIMGIRATAQPELKEKCMFHDVGAREISQFKLGAIFRRSRSEYGEGKQIFLHIFRTFTYTEKKSTHREEKEKKNGSHQLELKNCSAVNWNEQKESIQIVPTGAGEIKKIIKHNVVLFFLNFYSV